MHILHLPWEINQNVIVEAAASCESWRCRLLHTVHLLLRKRGHQEKFQKTFSPLLALQISGITGWHHWLGYSCCCFFKFYDMRRNVHALTQDPTVSIEPVGAILGLSSRPKRKIYSYLWYQAQDYSIRWDSDERNPDKRDFRIIGIFFQCSFFIVFSFCAGIIFFPEKICYV